MPMLLGQRVAARQLLLAAGRQELPGGHRCEDAGEDREPDERLMAKKDIWHWLTSPMPAEPQGLDGAVLINQFIS